MTAGRRSARWLALAAAGGVGLLLLPFLLSPYALLTLSYALVLSIACLGLNLLFGTTGLLSLGHAAYFGVGAYAGGFLYAFTPLESLELYLLSGLFASLVLAAGVGFLCVRATRIHFTILTLALAQVVHALFIGGMAFRPFGGVGKGLFLLGGGGLYIPRFAILGRAFAPDSFIQAFSWVVILAFLGSAVALWRIGRSPFGQALRAIRENETRAACIGIPVRRYRWYAFVLSGLFTGLAGGLHGQLSRQVTPEQLDWLFSAQLVLATVLGGTRLFAGPVLGAFAYVGLEDVALRWVEHRSLVMGLALIGVVFLFPEGLAGRGVALLAGLRPRAGGLRGVQVGAEVPETRVGDDRDDGLARRGPPG
ncbi:MAG: branched-chain amino acid ABC transporter permease [candidate division NC10 bacterium]|nr:branched-chain amino acid ABC transporter permease [candidate division NC10 bacterium]